MQLIPRHNLTLYNATWIQVLKKVLLATSAQALCPTKVFTSPHSLTGVSQSSTVVQEEIFGPVLTIQTFRTTEEAIEIANNTPYGLANGIWTDKGSKIFYVGAKLKSGVVWSNTYNKFDPTSPFGGYKESGKGREGGISGLHAYVKLENSGGM